MKAFTTYKTESSNIYGKIKSFFSHRGILIRMENLIVPGLPDCIYIYKGRAIFIELKISRNGKISMPKFQYSMAMDIKDHINPMSHWYFVYEDDGLGNELIGVYKFADLCRLTPEYDEVGTATKIIRLDIRTVSPIITFTKTADMLNWFALLDASESKNGRNHYSVT